MVNLPDSGEKFSFIRVLKKRYEQKKSDPDQKDASGSKQLFGGFLALQQLDFPDDLSVEYQKHITDHAEHENFNAYYNQEYSEDREGDMIDASQPLKEDIYTGQHAKNRREYTQQPEIEHRVVHPCQSVNGTYNLDAVMKRGEFRSCSRSAGIFYGYDHYALTVPNSFNRDLGLDLESFFLQVHLLYGKVGECPVPGKNIMEIPAVGDLEKKVQHMVSKKIET
jgi:hypothetical protein